MMRMDNKGRSASPHRITYKTDFNAIKCSFDTGTSLHPGPKAASVHQANPHDALMSHTSTSSGSGRVHRGPKIRENIFLQMDSQLLKPDSCPVQSPGSTTLHSPLSSSPQKPTSLLLDAFANTSPRESSLQDRPSRSEDIDRTALAQKFSVTRMLFENKVTDSEGVGSQMCKRVVGSASRGMADGKAEDKEDGGVACQTGREGSRHTKEHCFRKHTSMSTIDISLPQQSNGPKALNTSPSCLDKYVHTFEYQEVKTGTESASPRISLTPDKTVRAELVDVKNESSESDENEEDMMLPVVQNMLKDDSQEYLSKAGQVFEQDLVDDVFEDPSLEATSTIVQIGLAVGTDDNGSVTESRKDSSTTVPYDEEEAGEDKLWQVNKLWEGQRQESACAARLEEADKRVEESCEWQDSGTMQAESRTDDVANRIEACRKRLDTSKSETDGEPEDEEVKHKELPEGGDGKDNVCRGSDGSEFGTVNGAFRSEQESWSCPKHSTPPRQHLQNGSHFGRGMSLEYDEIPGVPEASDTVTEDAAKRKVVFSSAPIKVCKNICEVLFQYICFTVVCERVSASLLNNKSQCENVCVAIKRRGLWKGRTRHASVCQCRCVNAVVRIPRCDGAAAPMPD